MSLPKNTPVQRLNIPDSTANKVKYPYKKAKLRYVKNDNKNDWYIEFWAWDVKINRLRRKRIFSLNKISDLNIRAEFAKEQIKSINKALSRNFIFSDLTDEPTIKANTKSYKISEAFNLVLDEYINNRNNTFQTYSSVIRRFNKFLDENKLDKYIALLDDNIASEFQNYLRYDNELKNKSINYYITVLKNFGNILLNKGLINSNPFRKIKRLPEISTRQNFAFTIEEFTELCRLMKDADPQLYTFTQFMFYTFIRPHELIQLQIHHLIQGKIFIPGTISKSKKDGFVVIPEPLQAIITAMKLNQYSKNYYLFSKQQTPGKKMVNRIYFYTRFMNFLKKYNYPAYYTLYSVKHTGVVAAYQAGINIKAIQLQCRHSSILMTDIYLKSLGLMENKEFLEKMNFSI